MVSFCAVLFPYGMSWMRSWTSLSQFLRVFLNTHSIVSIDDNESASKKCYSIFWQDPSCFSLL